MTRPGPVRRAKHDATARLPDARQRRAGRAPVRDVGLRDGGRHGSAARRVEHDTRAGLEVGRQLAVLRGHHRLRQAHHVDHARRACAPRRVHIRPRWARAPAATTVCLHEGRARRPRARMQAHGPARTPLLSKHAKQHALRQAGYHARRVRIAPPPGRAAHRSRPWPPCRARAPSGRPRCTAPCCPA